jgi:hypothetical protein
MRNIDLDGEVCASHAAATPAWREKMIAAGIPAKSIAFGWCGVTRCLVEGGIFQPVDHGTEMVIVPVKHGDAVSPVWSHPDEIVRYGEVVDLIAFDLVNPLRWYQRTGLATWLGCIPPQLIDPDPVPIWRHPLNWLRSGGVGLTPLTRSGRETRELLLGVGKILAEDAHHAAQLKRALERPLSIPPIFIPDSATERAA